LRSLQRQHYRLTEQEWWDKKKTNREPIHKDKRENNIIPGYSFTASNYMTNQFSFRRRLTNYCLDRKHGTKTDMKAPSPEYLS